MVVDFLLHILSNAWAQLLRKLKYGWSGYVAADEVNYRMVPIIGRTVIRLYFECMQRYAEFFHDVLSA